MLMLDVYHGRSVLLLPLTQSGFIRPPLTATAFGRALQPQFVGDRPVVDERVDLLRAPGIEEDVALADARLLEQEAGGEELLADVVRERAIVARESAREMREVGVVAAPLP